MISASSARQVLGLIAVVAFASVQEARADYFDRFGPHKLLHLEQVLANPPSYLETVLRIPVRFNSYGSVFNPVFTRFVPERYLNFSAWSVDKRLWQAGDLVDDYPFFFVRKNNPEFKTFLRFKRFETMILLVRLGDLFKGQPYFEVLAVTRCDGKVTQENLLQVKEGYDDLKEQKLRHAAAHFHHAQSMGLPQDYEAIVQRELALIYLHLKMTFAAERELEKAIKLNPHDRMLERRHREMRQHNQNVAAQGKPVPAEPPITDPGAAAPAAKETPKEPSKDQPK